MNLWRKTPTPAAIAQPAASSQPAVSQPPPTRVLPRPSRPRPAARDRPWLHMALFVLTLASMTAAGARLQGVNPFTSLAHLSEGIPFAATLLGILTVHEFGHYFTARRWGVRASLPYFLPLPLFLGTLGAVIRIRSPIPDKRALMDIGAAGPLAGFVVAVAVCLVGLPYSTIVQVEDFYAGAPIQLGAPLLFEFMSRLVMPPLAPDQMVVLGPVAFAGWVGLFITAFNLFPVGQLDGGHVTYALFGRWHGLIARLCFACLLAMGVYGILSLMWGGPHPGWPGWLGLAVLLSIFGTDHPAPYKPNIPLDRRRSGIGYRSLAVFAVCFTPVPLSTLFTL